MFQMLYMCLLFGQIVSQQSVGVDERLSAAQARFAVDLMGQICGVENCVFSPYSIFNVLSMVALGAKGETSDQMMQVLQAGENYYQNNDQFHQQLGNLKRAVASGNGGGVQFSVADNVYLGNLPINEQYKEQVSSIYDIDGPQTVNFADEQATINFINNFISEATQGEITDFLSPKQITPQTLAVLVNAIFFKGTWKYQFDELNTRKANFSQSRKVKFEVDMMELQGNFRYSTTDPYEINPQIPKFDILELPYDNEDFVMQILKPFTSLNIARDQIKANDLLVDFDQRLSSVEKPIVVQLPKFQVSVKTDIDKALINLGMRNLFDVSSADLSGMAGVSSDPIYVSSAIHEAKIEVNEQGTKASAATGVGVVFESSVATFEVNQPFMFMLVHKPTKAIILIGQVVDPRQST